MKSYLQPQSLQQHAGIPYSDVHFAPRAGVTSFKEGVPYSQTALDQFWIGDGATVFTGGLCASDLTRLAALSKQAYYIERARSRLINQLVFSQLSPSPPQRVRRRRNLRSGRARAGTSPHHPSPASRSICGLLPCIAWFCSAGLAVAAWLTPLPSIAFPDAYGYSAGFVQVADNVLSGLGTLFAPLSYVASTFQLIATFTAPMLPYITGWLTSAMILAMLFRVFIGLHRCGTALSIAMHFIATNVKQLVGSLAICGACLSLLLAYGDYLIVRCVVSLGGLASWSFLHADVVVRLMQSTVYVAIVGSVCTACWCARGLVCSTVWMWCLWITVVFSLSILFYTAIVVGCGLPPELDDFSVGDSVLLRNLVADPHLNGARGKVVSFVRSTQRVGVRLDDGSQSLLVRPDCLQAS
jgi:hypothetical protein